MRISDWSSDVCSSDLSLSSIDPGCWDVAILRFSLDRSSTSQIIDRSSRPPLQRRTGMTMQPQLWGGLECTVNRVHDRYQDQVRATGHQDRAEDLDRLAMLGIRAIRYPVLWERVSPRHPDARDWQWTDERLGRLRHLDDRKRAVEGKG